MNLVFIALDTLRADHLGCYGYPKATSPALDALAERGTLVERFYSVGNCTHPGFTAMLSGLYPESTGVVSHWTEVNPPEEVPMMAQYFRRAGYRTWAVDNLCDGWVERGFRRYAWFRRGYERYEHPGDFHTPAEQCIQMAQRWLEGVGEEPFLLFVHLWDAHAPYRGAPEQFQRFYHGEDPCDPRLDYIPPTVRKAIRGQFDMPVSDPAYVVAAYDAQIAYCDHCIGKLLETLERLNLLDGTTVLVTADHGEIMSTPRLCVGQVWCFSHIGLFEDCLRVPLIMAGPQVAPGRTQGPSQLVDILPTLLEWFELPQQIELDGMSLAPALRGKEQSGRPAFFSENTYQKQRAVLHWPWKYMRCEQPYDATPRRGLYHLERDPMELVNLTDSMPEQLERMDERIQHYVARVSGRGPDPLVEQPVSRSRQIRAEQISY